MSEMGLLVEFMTDEEKRDMSYGEVTTPALNDELSFSDGGLMSPRIFGEKEGTVCTCGACHDKGAWCPDCGTQAVEGGWKDRIGHIELPVGWYGGFSSLLSEILGLQGKRYDREKSFKTCYRNEKPLQLSIPVRVYGRPRENQMVARGSKEGPSETKRVGEEGSGSEERLPKDEAEIRKVVASFYSRCREIENEFVRTGIRDALEEKNKGDAEASAKEYDSFMKQPDPVSAFNAAFPNMKVDRDGCLGRGRRIYVEKAKKDYEWLRPAQMDEPLKAFLDFVSKTGREKPPKGRLWEVVKEMDEAFSRIATMNGEAVIGLKKAFPNMKMDSKGHVFDLYRIVSNESMEVKGPYQLEEAASKVDLKTVEERLKKAIADDEVYLREGFKTEEGSKRGSKKDSEKDAERRSRDRYAKLLQTERRIEELEMHLDSVMAMQTLGLTAADLFTHVQMVAPIQERELAELGSDPLGRLNSAYTEILLSKQRLLEANRDRDANPSSSLAVSSAEAALEDFAATMERTFPDLDLFGHDRSKSIKEFGQQFQKSRTPESVFGTAESNKNLPIDAVAIPYNMLMGMYGEEVLQKLVEPLERELEDLQRQEGSDGRKEELSSFLSEKRQEYRDRLFEEQYRFSVSEDFRTALEEVLQGKVVLLDRFPNVSRDSIVAMRPVLSRDRNSISVNPNICERMGLDHDGDQVHVHKLSEAISQRAMFYAGPTRAPFSSRTGDPLHLNEREDSLGIWLATRIDVPEQSCFKRDAVVTGVAGGLKDDVLQTEGFVYARHVLWEGDEGFERTSAQAVVRGGDVIGKDGRGRDVKAPWFGMLVERDGRHMLLSLGEDRIHLPKGARLSFDAPDLEAGHAMEIEGPVLKAGKPVADWSVREFDSMEDVSDAYWNGEIDANCAIDLRFLSESDDGRRVDVIDPLDMGGRKPLRTCFGRVMVCDLASPDNDAFVPRAEVLCHRIGRDGIVDLFKTFYEEVWNRTELSEDDRLSFAMEIQKQMQDMGAEFAETYASFSEFDILKYEPTHERRNGREVVRDDFYRFNSIEDQVRSGAKGTQKNIESIRHYLIGQDTLLDAENIKDLVGRLDKAGKKESDGISPVQRVGSIQRILCEALYDFHIEKEDCGTDMYEELGYGGLYHQTVSEKDLANQIEGRYLARDYVTKDGILYPKGTMLGVEDSREIAFDAKASGSNVAIRTVSGCLCNGGCSKCYGKEPTRPTEVEVGSRIGLSAVMACTSGILEMNNLKAIANSGTENASSAGVFQRVLNGGSIGEEPSVWETGALGTPMDAQREMLEKLEALIWDMVGIKVSRKHLEVLSRALVNVKVEDLEGKRTEKIVYGRYLREYMNADPKRYRLTLRLRPYAKAAVDPWFEAGDRGAVAVGGVEAMKNLGERGLKRAAQRRGGLGT